MSLLIDTLSKIKGGKKGKPVPPNLKKSRKKDKKHLVLLFSFIVVLSSAAIFLYILQDRLLQEENNILYEIKTQKKEIPEQKPKNIAKVKKEKINKPQKSEFPVKILKTPEKKQVEQKSEPEIKNAQPKKSKEPKKSSSYLYSTYISLGNKYLEKQDYIKSLSYYLKAYQINPSERLLKNIIVLQIYTGEKNNALSNLKKIKNPQAISQILIFLIENGEINLVRGFLSNKLEDKSGYLSYTKGVLEEKSGEIEKAHEYYKKAFKLNPYDPYIAYAYARILEIKGLTKKAFQVYRYINRMSISDNNLRKIVEDRIKLLGGSYE